MRTRQLFVAMSIFVAGTFGYAVLAPQPDRSRPEAASATPAADVSPSAPPVPAFDVRHLLKPKQDYLGVAIDGAPKDMGKVEAFADRTGTRPNMITIYESFDDGFAAAEIRNIYRYGALPILRWEPYKQKMSDIAAGEYDAYITEFAGNVRKLNLPIALTIGHEMNGHWYPWGASKTKARDFVAAWRHIHDIFAAADATNVIWTWTPNVINFLRGVKLKPLYPGNAYVDWVGMDGYFTHRGNQDFDALFRPTIKEIRRFTDKPLLIVETGSEPGAMRAPAVQDLFTSVAASKEVIGFVYFNQKGSANWVIDDDQAALKVYRSHRDRKKFGFTVR